MNKKAFTLAEVLITIGIVAVVAALTIPVLIANHQKKVVAVRLQKFYSAFNQALFMSIIDNGDMSTWTFPDDYYDWEGSCTFFNTYLKKYMQYIDDFKCERKNTVWPTYGVEITLPDGSAFNLAGTWVTFYPVSGKRRYVNRDIFLFNMSKNNNKFYPFGYERNRNEILQNTHFDMNCQKANVDESTALRTRSCAAVIMQDGWEIRDDYPW